METISLPIYNTEGKEVDTVKLDAKIFDGIIDKAVLHQAVSAYLANQRKGLASTKTRGEVSGGGRKRGECPDRQIKTLLRGATARATDARCC